MRIISGTHKGRTIPLPKNYKARPTTDFAKESLFNIMANHFDFEELVALDLFSGTGSISFELASRGFADVTSVELNFQNFKHIKLIAETFGLKQVQALKSNAFSYLKTCTKKFDFIFADPPYEMKDIETIPEIIFERNLLKENAWFVLEHSKNISFSNHKNLFDHRDYGSVNFSFFKSLVEE